VSQKPTLSLVNFLSDGNEISENEYGTSKFYKSKKSAPKTSAQRPRHVDRSEASPQVARNFPRNPRNDISSDAGPPSDPHHAAFERVEVCPTYRKGINQK
jgi:hypothetical protein